MFPPRLKTGVFTPNIGMILDQWFGKMIVGLVKEHEPISHEDLFSKFCERDEDEDIVHNDIVRRNFNDYIRDQLEQNKIKRVVEGQCYVVS